MTEIELRQELADEISGVVVGSGYGSVSIGISAALEAADQILASDVLRKAMRAARAAELRNAAEGFLEMARNGVLPELNREAARILTTRAAMVEAGIL